MTLPEALAIALEKYAMPDDPHPTVYVTGHTPDHSRWYQVANNTRVPFVAFWEFADRNHCGTWRTRVPLYLPDERVIWEPGARHPPDSWVGPPD